MNAEEYSKVTQAITGTFMWSFKKGDNIVYNFDIVWELYKARDAADASHKKKYNKPIILLQVSIIECILDDFVNRIGQHVHDRVPNITPTQIKDFKTRKIDKLEPYIAASKKHNLFDANDRFYADMDLLRRARNRFHIQNANHLRPANESSLFTSELLHKSERVFEVVLERMMTKFFRGSALNIQFADVPLPWPRVIPLPTSLEEDDSPWLCIGCGEVYPAEIPYCIDCALPRP